MFERVYIYHCDAPASDHLDAVLGTVLCGVAASRGLQGSLLLPRDAACSLTSPTSPGVPPETKRRIAGCPLALVDHAMTNVGFSAFTWAPEERGVGNPAQLESITGMPTSSFAGACEWRHQDAA